MRGLAALLIAVVAGAQSFQARAQAPAPACAQRIFEGDPFTVCPFDSRKQDLTLVWRKPDGAAYRGFAALPPNTPGRVVRFAMNAGMYDAAGAPIGLYVERGKEFRAINLGAGSGNFYMKPNGVFWVDELGGVHVATTQAYATGLRKPVWATQSGPMLVVGGALHPAIQPDGASRNVRNGVGVQNDHTAYFVISDQRISFGKFARLFRDELRCPDALYLDGLVSSLWAPQTGRMDSKHRLGPMLVVSERK